MTAPAVLLTGVGKRYDIVSAFAQHTTVVAADPNPLAPAQYAAQVRTAVPRFDDPAYVPELEGLCAEHGVGAVVPLTDLDLEVLALAREAGRLPAFVPDPGIAVATFDKYETHRLLRRLGLPSPPTVLPGEPVDFLPAMVKPRRGSGARSIHPAHDAEQVDFFCRYVDEPVMVQKLMQGPEFSIDLLSDTRGRCLNAIPRSMLESRGGESIKGTVLDDPAGVTGAGRTDIGMADGLERLWTPHRMTYISGEDRPEGGYEKPTGCPFCLAPGLPPDESLIVARGEHVFVVLNLYPYNPGHLLVCPYRHVADYTDLDVPETVEVASFTQTAMRVIRQVSNAHGFNLGMNQGGVAGAGIAAHLHQHVVPRWGGDANFMPVIGRTKVLPQLLADTRDLLAKAWPA